MSEQDPADVPDKQDPAHVHADQADDAGAATIPADWGHDPYPLSPPEATRDDSMGANVEHDDPAVYDPALYDDDDQGVSR